jgi:hypothetical protein
VEDVPVKTQLELVQMRGIDVPVVFYFKKFWTVPGLILVLSDQRVQPSRDAAIYFLAL